MLHPEIVEYAKTCSPKVCAAIICACDCDNDMGVKESLMQGYRFLASLDLNENAHLRTLLGIKWNTAQAAKFAIANALHAIAIIESEQ